MKKLLLAFLFIAAAFIVQAQDMKPTKEQTIEFIMNKLKGYSDSRSFERAGAESTLTREVKDVSFIDSVFYIKMWWCKVIYSERVRTNEYITEYKINLKNIEAINMGPNDLGQSFIEFKCLNEAKLIVEKKREIKPDLKNTDDKVSYASIYAPSDDKLVKAFNHLRKLCGAPEPISFD